MPKVVTLIATPIAAVWPLYTYHRRAKLDRAQWLKELYEKFNESDNLKKVRDQLDGEDVAKISALVKAEDSSFTDYLNFFEFIAYLVESKQIEEHEMLGLFHYYLRNLVENAQVKNYINDKAKGFEKLQRQLKRLTA